MDYHIENNSRKYKCAVCRKDVTTRRKVVRYGGRNRYHISCLHKWIKSKLIAYKKINSMLIRYKNDMVLEELSK